jgi:hypothetical protein
MFRRPQRTSLIRTAIVVTVALSMVSTAMSPATAAPPKPAPVSALSQLGISVAADGWITYGNQHSSSLPLTNVGVKTVKGARTPEGQCAITGALDASSTATYTEQIGFNPTTCESRVLSGDLTPAAEAALADQSPKATVAGKTATPAAAKTAPSGGNAVATSYQSAHTTTRWIDPVNIVITSQAINMTWPLYGAGGSLNASAPYYAFPYDGWSVYGPYFTPFYTLSDNSGWYIGANSHFVNYDFAAIVYALLGLTGWLACGALPTTRADFYHNVQVTGYRSGGKGHWWSDSVSGACSNLVHHETLTGYGNW